MLLHPLSQRVPLSQLTAVTTIDFHKFPVVYYVPFVKDGSVTTIPGAANGLYISYNETHLPYHGIASIFLPSVQLAVRISVFTLKWVPDQLLDVNTK